LTAVERCKKSFCAGRLPEQEIVNLSCYDIVISLIITNNMTNITKIMYKLQAHIDRHGIHETSMKLFSLRLLGHKPRRNILLILHIYTISVSIKLVEKYQ